MSSPFLVGSLNSEAATSNTVDVTASTSGGDIIVVITNHTASSVSDSQGNTYSLMASRQWSTGTQVLQAWMAGNTTALKAGTDTVTIELSTDIANDAAIVDVGANALFSNVVSSGTGTAWSVSYGSPVRTSGQVIVFESNGVQPPSFGSGITELVILSGNGAGFALVGYITAGVTIGGSVSGTIAGSEPWAAGALGFAPTSPPILSAGFLASV